MSNESSLRGRRNFLPLSESVSKAFGLFGFLLLIAGCGQMNLPESYYDQAEAKYYNEVDLVSEGSVTIHLDSVTSPISYAIQYKKTDTEELLYYWNRQNRSINTFDLSTGEIINKQFFSESGPNGLSGESFLVLDKDSVILFHGNQGMGLTDSRSVVLDKFPVADVNKVRYLPSGMVWTGSPLIYFKDRLFFQVFAGGIFDQSNMAVFNIETKELDYFSGYPDIYRQAYWRGGFDRMYSTFDPTRGKLVFSYAADHHLWVQSVQNPGNSMSYFASSSELGPIRAPRLKMSSSGKELDEQKYMLQPSFGIIHYDRFHDLYYRFGFEGIPETEYFSGHSKKSRLKQGRIIILDGEFRKVGEHLLPGFVHVPEMSFVGKKGLYLKRSNEEDEDIVEFDILKPIKQQIL